MFALQCRKDTFISSELENSHTALDTFFLKGFVENENTYIETAVEEKNLDNPIVEHFYNRLYEIDRDIHFSQTLIDSVGYPAWSWSKHITDSSGIINIVFTPLVDIQGEGVKGYLAGLFNADKSKEVIFVVNRENLNNLLVGNGFNGNTIFYSLGIWEFDLKLFGSEDTILTNNIRGYNLLQQDSLKGNPTSEDRGNPCKWLAMRMNWCPTAGDDICTQFVETFGNIFGSGVVSSLESNLHFLTNPYSSDPCDDPIGADPSFYLEGFSTLPESSGGGNNYSNPYPFGTAEVWFQNNIVIGCEAVSDYNNGETTQVPSSSQVALCEDFTTITDQFHNLDQDELLCIFSPYNENFYQQILSIPHYNKPIIKEAILWYIDNYCNGSDLQSESEYGGANYSLAESVKRYEYVMNTLVSWLNLDPDDAYILIQGSEIECLGSNYSYEELMEFHNVQTYYETIENEDFPIACPGNIIFNTVSTATPPFSTNTVCWSFITSYNAITSGNNNRISAIKCLKIQFINTNGTTSMIQLPIWEFIHVGNPLATPLQMQNWVSGAINAAILQTQNAINTNTLNPAILQSDVPSLNGGTLTAQQLYLRQIHDNFYTFCNNAFRTNFAPQMQANIIRYNSESLNAKYNAQPNLPISHFTNYNIAVCP
jgi:hypothetical protein